jgi:hypothetical protein
VSKHLEYGGFMVKRMFDEKDSLPMNVAQAKIFPSDYSYPRDDLISWVLVLDSPISSQFEMNTHLLQEAGQKNI